MILCKILCLYVIKVFKERALVFTGFQRDGLEFEPPVHLCSVIYRLDIVLSNFTSREAVGVAMLTQILTSCLPWCPKQFLCQHQLQCWERVVFWALLHSAFVVWHWSQYRAWRQRSMCETLWPNKCECYRSERQVKTITVCTHSVHICKEDISVLFFLLFFWVCRCCVSFPLQHLNLVLFYWKISGTSEKHIHI